MTIFRLRLKASVDTQALGSAGLDSFGGSAVSEAEQERWKEPKV